MNRTGHTVVLTFLCTSIFWFVVAMIAGLRTNGGGSEESEMPGYSEAIVGVWTPVEGAEDPLEFTKYGTFECNTILGFVKMQYGIERDRVSASTGFFSLDFRVKLYTDGRDTYLEIYDLPSLAGKYRKVVRQQADRQQAEAAEPATKPAATVAAATATKAAAATTTAAAERRSGKTVRTGPAPAAGGGKERSAAEERPAPEPDTGGEDTGNAAAEERQQAPMDYSKAIVGRWIPVEGAENPLEFTKYGTVIQWLYDDMLDIRRDYSVKGDKVDFEYGGTGRVEISTDAGGTYLEIYDNTEYSGKYKKEQ